MASKFDMSVEIPEEVLDNFLAACNRYSDELGNSGKVALRRGTITLIKSLRARTVKAKKSIPSKDVQPYKGHGPRYITPKGKGQQSQLRYSIKRRGGLHTYVHAAESKADARRKYGNITRWGLAKKSWGWFMHELCNRNMPVDNPKAKINDSMVGGYMSEYKTGVTRICEVLIVNKLNYIRKALPAGALYESLKAATNSINTQIDRNLAQARKELDK